MSPATPAPDRRPHRVAVVGYGMAGARFVDDLLALQRSGAGHPCRVTVVGAEPYSAYNRVLLSDVVAGRADATALALSDPQALAAAGVQVLLSRHVQALDLPAGTGPGRLVLDDGTRLDVDRVVLATGAAPTVPRLDGLDPDRPPAGVHTLRTLDDAREIVAAASNARRAVVLGGGLLGLEAGRGLARRGLDVTVLHRGPHPLDRQLDPGAGAVLGRSLARLGVTVLTGSRTTAVRSRPGPAGPQLTGVLLRGADGDPEVRELDCDLLVIACGVRPRTGLATAAGLATGSGVLVDRHLLTSDPRVLAIGDCAEFDGEVPGLVAPAWEQARVAAAVVAGTDAGAGYRGHRPLVRLKAADIEVCAVGETAPQPWDDEPGLEVVQLVDPGRGRYLKAVIRHGVVVGGLAVGGGRAASELGLLVERRAAAPADRALLLLPGARSAPSTADDPTLIPDRATVCRCNGVTKGAVVGAWQAGARSVEQVAARTRASTGCGTCRDAVCGLVEWLTAIDPDDPPAARPPGPSARPATTAPTATADPTAGSAAELPAESPTDPIPTGGPS